MSKGGSYEREVCKLLTHWFSGGEVTDDCWFWRSSNSGGRATIRHRKGQKTSGHCGDIAATCDEGRPFTDLLTTEVKRGYSRSSLQDLLDRPKPKKNQKKPAVQPYEGFILQAVAAHERAGTWGWLLIVRRDQRPALAIGELHSLEVLADLDGLDSLDFPHWRGRTDITRPGPLELYCVRLDDWLEIVTPQGVRELATDWNNRNKKGA